MKRIILLIISICCLEASAQEIHKNSLSTSLIRLEKNSQTTYGNFKLKFMTGIEYQRFVNKWSLGIKYGFNKIEEYSTTYVDCFYGAGYIREDNIYLTANYSRLNLFNSRLKLNTGVSLYYSNLKFSGGYQGGLSGVGTRKN